MSELFHKELRLAASPLSYWFLAMAGMTMLPGYPILVGAFMICLGIFYTYQFGREQNDIVYTALLPVAKGDIVRAKFRFVVCIQLIGFMLCAVLTVIRMVFLEDAAVYTQNQMMNANFVYLGWVLLIFALFQVIFLRGFFRTAYAFGKPFLIFCAMCLILIGVAETMHHVPGLQWMNTTGFAQFGMQLVFFLCCAAVYGIATVISMRLSVRRMEQIDL